MSKAPTQVGTSTNTTSSAPPPYVQDAQKNLMEAAGGLTLPFAQQGPPSTLAAPLNDTQQWAGATAANNVQQSYNVPIPVYTANAAGGSAAQLGAGDINSFFNPYQKDVVGTTEQQLGEANDKTLAAIRARQGAEGAYGGNRGALEESEQNRNYGNTLASTVAGLNQSGWNNAANLGMGNAQMRQQTGMQNTQNQQQANIFNAQQQTNAKTQEWEHQMQALQGLMGWGNQQQQQAQKETMQPYTALDIFRGVVPGTYASSGTSSQPIYGASPFQTALGVGTLGAGLLGGASDRTLKTDIQKLGEDEKTGLDMYAFRYKGDPKNTMKVVGPMAQDVEVKFPGSTVRVGGKLAIKPAARMMLGF